MSCTTLAVLALSVLPAIAFAQTDTTRRDTTRTTADTIKRVPREARGEVDVSASGARFSLDRPNYGLSSDQAMQLQRALSSAGCDAGTIDGVIGQRTQRSLECFAGQRGIVTNDLEALFTALNLSYARPPAPPPPVAPKRDSTVLPPVIRSFLPDTSARRDTLRRDTTARGDTTRRDSTARRDTVRKP